jgi:hypothetical protein
MILSSHDPEGAFLELAHPFPFPLRLSELPELSRNLGDRPRMNGFEQLDEVDGYGGKRVDPSPRQQPKLPSWFVIVGKHIRRPGVSTELKILSLDNVERPDTLVGDDLALLSGDGALCP